MEAPEYDLKALKAAANEALKRAAGKVNDAVRWMYVDCYSAERAVDDEGDVSYRVYIDNASPDANDLRIFVANDLGEHGFPGVMVNLEW